jgi:hypothetical protein
MDSRSTDAEVAHLVAVFADCSLPRSHWDHRAHLVVALAHLQGVEFEAGLGRLRSGIRRYNAAWGRADGYHETLTVFWARLVAAFLAAEGEGRPPGELALATVLCARYGDRQALPFCTTHVLQPGALTERRGPALLAAPANRAGEDPLRSLRQVPGIQRGQHPSGSQRLKI